MRLLMLDGRFVEVGPHPDVAGRPDSILVRTAGPSDREFVIEVTQPGNVSTE